MKVHSMTHTNLVDEIVNNVEKHLEEKCRKLEETLASERLIIKRNIENIEELKVLVKKADESTSNVNKSVVEKEEELVKSKNMLNKEICENEKKSAEIIALKLTIARRDKDIEDLKKNRAEPNDNTKKLEEVISKLNQRLDETRELCVEYNHKIENNKKENKEEVDKISMEKMKVEEELRTAILEKNLLRDSERILLQTFDTLKMHYDTKKNNADTEDDTRRDKEDQNKDKASSKTEYQCKKCEYKTGKKDVLRAHEKKKHEDRTSLYDNGYQYNRNEKFLCEECDYKTPFVSNINIHKSEAHGKWQDVRRRKRQSQGGGRQPQQHFQSKQKYSYQERRSNGFCIFWNQGNCQYSDGFKFLHEESPECYYGDRCNRKSFCTFFHADVFESQQTSALLSQRQNQNYRTQ